MNESNSVESLASSWRALLLHRLPDDAAQALERELLAAPHAVDALQEAEHDLHDDYAGGRLSAEDRAAFERYLLRTPEARDRLRLARALAAISAGPAADLAQLRRRRQRLVLVGGALAAGLALSLALLPQLRAPSDSAPTAAEAEPQTLVLLASVDRGAEAGAVAVRLEAGRTQLRVQAEIAQPDAQARYRLSLIGEDAAARPLLQIDDLPLLMTGRYRYVEALLPVANLAAGRAIRVESQAPGAGFAQEWPLRIEP